MLSILQLLTCWHVLLLAGLLAQGVWAIAYMLAVRNDNTISDVGDIYRQFVFVKHPIITMAVKTIVAGAGVYGIIFLVIIGISPIALLLARTCLKGHEMLAYCVALAAAVVTIVVWEVKSNYSERPECAPTWIRGLDKIAEIAHYAVSVICEIVAWHPITKTAVGIGIGAGAVYAYVLGVLFLINLF